MAHGLKGNRPRDMYTSLPMRKAYLNRFTEDARRAQPRFSSTTAIDLLDFSSSDAAASVVFVADTVSRLLSSLHKDFST